MYQNWEELEQECNNCKKCKLCEDRKNVVIGTGNKNAQIMFIGEGPGADEDEQGIPFVGKAGQLMNKAFEGVGIKREEVYIANIVKCRPPQNRNPEKDEADVRHPCQPAQARQTDRETADPPKPGRQQSDD